MLHSFPVGSLNGPVNATCIGNQSIPDSVIFLSFLCGEGVMKSLFLKRQESGVKSPVFFSVFFFFNGRVWNRDLPGSFLKMYPCVPLWLWLSSCAVIGYKVKHYLNSTVVGCDLWGKHSLLQSSLPRRCRHALPGKGVDERRMKRGTMTDRDSKSTNYSKYVPLAGH